MGYWWRSKDEHKSVVILWTPSYVHANVDQPTRTYLQQICMDTGSCLKDYQEEREDSNG